MGFRVRSNRQSTQTVQERKQQEQKDQLQQQVRRNVSKPKKKPVPQQQPLKQKTEFDQAGTQPNRSQNRSLQSSAPSQSLLPAQQPNVALLQSQSAVWPSKSLNTVEVPQIRVAIQNMFHYDLNRPEPVQQQKFTRSSPPKQKQRSSTHDKDFYEQLAEYKVLDKVMPCLDYVEGVFVQVIESQIFATVLAYNKDESLVIKSLKGEQLSVMPNQVKFLTGAYVFPLCDIAMGNASDPLALDLNIEDSSKSESSLILVQAIFNQTSQENNADQAVGSIHRLHALVVNRLTGDLALHPVQFPSNQKQSKRQQKQPISYEEDEELDDPQLFAYGNAEITTRILKFSRQIALAYNSYKSQIQKIPLTSDNSHSLLYSLCSIQQQMDDQVPSSQKMGILTRVKNGQAFMRYFRTKSDWGNEPIQEWLGLDQVQIIADLTLGFVSLQSLSQRSVFDVKLRNLKFVSQKESQSQEKFRVLTAIEDLCRVCKYVPVGAIKNLTCAGCQYQYHEQCLEKHQILQDQNGGLWYCPKCIKCQNCKANQSDLIVCHKCNVAVHFECLEKAFSQKLQTLDKLSLNQFNCENCICCKSCGTKVSDADGEGKWSSDFQLCTLCEQKRELKMYCIGCLKFWQEPTAIDQMLQCSCCQMWVHPTCDRMLEEPANLNKLQLKDENNKPLVLYACYSCRQKARANFIDQIVDCMVVEDKKEEFKYPFWHQPNNAGYLTIIKQPLCFSMIKQEIENFINMDHSGHLNAIPQLRYLTLSPDEKRQEKLQLDKKTKDELTKDIDLIFCNAKNFNQPTSDIHKLAVRMHEKCIQILKQGRIPEILEQNMVATHDELQHLKYLRGSLEQEPVYLLKSKDLFDDVEQIDVQTNQYVLRSREGSNVGQVVLGKRQRDNSLQSNLKRQRLENGELSNIGKSDFDLVSSYQCADSMKLFADANRRLLEQNLSKLRQTPTNLSSLQIDKLPFKQIENDSAQLQCSPRSRWKALMDYLRVSDEGDTCWYSNPIRISFDDPSFIFEEMCYLCGSFGLREEFLCCNLCSESFHPYCLPCPKEITANDKDDWFCYNCIFCQKCHSSKNWESLLLCAVCDKPYHYQCLNPQLIQAPAPEVSWKCPDCFKCRCCDSKDFFSADDIANKVNLDPTQKYYLSFDFEFCYQCGQDQYRKSFCSICQIKTGLGLSPEPQKKSYYSKVQLTTDDQCSNIELLKCTTCSFYSHLSCSRTNINVINKLSQTSYFNGYQCLDCLLTDKNPGFYLHEQCALYEDLHQRMERFALISQLCNTILTKYTRGEHLVLEQYVQQNFQWLSTDSFVNKWIDLLRTEVDYEMSDTAVTEQQNKTQKPALKFNSMKEFAEGLFQSEFNSQPDILMYQPRDMYLNLYKTLNGFEDQSTQIPVVEIDDEWLKPTFVDFDELFIQVEMRAILKIKIHFFNWVENDLVEAAIQHQHLFVKDQPSELQNQLKMILDDEEQKVVQVPVQNQQQIQQCDQASAEQDVALSDEVCNEEDGTIVNPQNRLTCILCQQSGEKRITGRLIPFQVNQFVHVNCAMWTQEVKEGTEESVVSSELYNFYFAFRAFRNNVCAFCGLKGATLTCTNHQSNRKCVQPYFHFPCAYKSGQISFQHGIEVYCELCTKKDQNLKVGLPIKFKNYHRRRFIIVKNLKAQCTDAFKTENGGDVEYKQSDSAQPQQYIVNCNKWRPYYYDMFNRAGNLTIISLSQQANRIIETLHNQSNQQITWHERLKKKTQTDQLSDFASVRITWKQSERKKGFFLFTQNDVRQLEGKDVSMIVPYMTKQLRHKMSQAPTTLNAEVATIDEFYQRQIGFLRQRYQYFQQDSTYLKSDSICGLEKYPIQYWNNPMLKDGIPLKDLSVANFFYKSADIVIQRQHLYTQRSQTEPQVQFEQPALLNDLQSTFQKILEANKFVNHDGFTPAQVQNLGNSKWKTPNVMTELQIKQKLSSLSRSQPVFNQLSFKEMNYDQVMGCLGKKTRNQRKLMRQAQTSPLLIDSDDDFKKNSSIQHLTDADGSKQTSDAINQGKSSECNLAMRYRALKKYQKQVEVWSSKIHRNGLFACQQFNPKDIVIEYVGEKIRVPVCNKREVEYDKAGVDDCYFFAFDTEHIIDATFYGNKSRYINHSCEPNLKSETITVDNKTHIIFIANRLIEKHEELTFDYQFEYESEKIECFCGTAVCKGRLN